jgi:NAD+ diphosphatase
VTRERPRYALRGAELLVRAGAAFAARGAAEPDAAPEAASDTAPWLALSCADEVCEGAVDRFSLPISVGSQGGAAAGGEVLSFPKDAPAPLGWEWRPLRAAILGLPEEAWLPAARAMAYANWRAAARYCGRCGAPNLDIPGGEGRRCGACGALSFPRLSPAVLVVARKGDTLLLARNAQNATGFWSLVAGFVEPGETFEDCVRRELMEEVGIEAEVGAYAGSQPWPFPDQLMLGFEANWVAGELKPDGEEIAEAGWFGPEDHPPIPNPGSLSRRLIDRAFARIRDERRAEAPRPR